MNTRDDGVSLVEVLVGMALFGVLSSILLGMSMSTSQVTQDVRRISRMNEDNQLAMERITRELRQATLVTGLHRSTGPSDPAHLEFAVDFDGAHGAATAVTVRYEWDPEDQELTISEGASSGVLASGVTAFTVDAGSTLWQYDDGDGDTTWQELDAAGAPVGNTNGVLDVELAHVDRLELTLSVEDDPEDEPESETFNQTYVTKVDMRNVDPNP